MRDACGRERVTSTVLPNSGRLSVASNHESSSRSFTTSPTMKIAGGAKTFAISGGKLCDWSEKDVTDARELVLQAAADWRGTTREAVEALKIVASFDWNPSAQDEVRGKLAALRAKGSFLRGLSVLFGGSGVLRFSDGVVGRFDGFGGDFTAKLDAAIAAMDESRGAMRYRASVTAAAKRIGDAFAVGLADGSVDPNTVGESFDRSFAEATLNEILRVESALASFAGLKREEQIVEFRRLARSRSWSSAAWTRNTRSS